MAAVEKTESEKTTLETVQKWFLNSPSHGIRRIGRAKTLTGSLFGAYIFWIFTVLMGCFIYKTVINFVAHQTKIHLSVSQYRDPKHFPAITFCNINPLKNDGFLTDVRNSRLPGGQSSATLTESEYRHAVSAYIQRILAAQVNGQRHPFVEWGFTLDDLLITCIYNKRYCNKNLTPLFHPNYGNCYTFDNEQHVESEAMDIYQYWSLANDNMNSDENYKLFLELFLHQKEYNEYLEQRAAFRIFIHQKNEVPVLSENSLFIGPNKYTKISFSPRVTSFSQQCQTDLTDDMKPIFLTHQVRYTQALCYKLCKHKFILEQCQCIESTLALFYQFFNNNQTTTNISLCPIDNKCPFLRKYFNSSKLCPKCLPECEIIQYTVQSSYAHYPNVKAYDKVLQRVRNHFHLDRQTDAYLNMSDVSSTNRRTRLRDNIVAIEISAGSYATEILTESRIYTWVDLISSIGGQTGLWIGVSLISFVEIIELLYLLLNRC